MTIRDEILIEAFKASRALKTVADLDNVFQCRFALLHAGRTEDEIDNLLTEAIECERERRTLGNLLRVPLEASALAMGIFGLACQIMPNNAIAADSTWRLDPETGLTILLLVLSFGLGLLLATLKKKDGDTLPLCSCGIDFFCHNKCHRQPDDPGYDSTPPWRR